MTFKVQKNLISLKKLFCVIYRFCRKMSEISLALYQATIRVLGIISLLLLVLGTLGNSFGIYICARRSLRVCPTFVFYIFILINDTMCLYFWNLNHFLRPYFNFILEDISLLSCKLVTAFQFASLQSTAWILV